MTPLWKRSALAVLVAGSALLATGMLYHAAGARINTSRSIPLGLYWTSSLPVARHAYVQLCPPQLGVIDEAKRRHYLPAGFCPGGYGYLMKKVAAVTNDVVEISDTGVTVNGVLLPNSAPLPHDAAGRPMPRYQASRFVIGNSEVLLMSDVSATSFDGRYIGPINRSQIRSVIVPVLTWR